MKTTLAHQLANYSSSFRFEDLSKEGVHEVKRRVSRLAGLRTRRMERKSRVRSPEKSHPIFRRNTERQIFGTNHKAPPDWTAFANGCCIRYFDYNDTYLSKEPAHPSDNISAAAGCGGKRRRKWAGIDRRDRTCL